jgi:hypothetical protein
MHNALLVAERTLTDREMEAYLTYSTRVVEVSRCLELP